MPKKAHLGVKVVKSLGHRVTADEMAPDPGKVDALTKTSLPTNVSQLRSLMGGVGYYRTSAKNGCSNKYIKLTAEKEG